MSDEQQSRPGQKHGISFEEATALFKGESDYLEIYNEEHSEEEDRFIAVGRIERGVVVVVFTERDEGVVRIMCARMTTMQECQKLEDYERKGYGRRY